MSAGRRVCKRDGGLFYTFIVKEGEREEGDMGKMQGKQDPQSRAPDCLGKVGVFVYYVCIKMAGVHVEAMHVKLKGYAWYTNCILLLPSGLHFVFPCLHVFVSVAVYLQILLNLGSVGPCLCLWPPLQCVRVRMHTCALTVSAHLHHLHSVVIWPLLCATGFLWKCHADIFSD